MEVVALERWLEFTEADATASAVANFEEQSRNPLDPRSVFVVPLCRECATKTDAVIHSLMTIQSGTPRSWR